MKNLQMLGMFAATAVVLPLGLAAGLSDGGGTRGGVAPFVPPVLREAEAPDSAVVSLPVPPEIKEGPAPVLRHATPAFPAEFMQDSVAFLRSHLGEWQASEAIALLGASTRQRPSYDDDGKPNGAIYAFTDPLHRYREYELDFEGATGKLRTIFVYPLKMSWRDCRKVYGSSVSTTSAGNGRAFHSYVDRRLDVLVDASGNVISLGIY